MKEKRITMSNAEVIQAGLLLQQHMVPSAQTEGLWLFEEGWNDEKIAEATGGRISASHVERLRRSLGLKLETRAVEYSAEMAELRKQIEYITERHNALCDALSLNKILDVRDYRIDV